MKRIILWVTACTVLCGCSHKSQPEAESGINLLPFDYCEYQLWRDKYHTEKSAEERKYPYEHEIKKNDSLYACFGKDGYYMPITDKTDYTLYLVRLIDNAYRASPVSFGGDYYGVYLVSANRNDSPIDCIDCLTKWNMKGWKKHSFTISADSEVTLYENELKGDDIVSRRPIAKYKINDEGKFIPETEPANKKKADLPFDYSTYQSWYERYGRGEAVGYESPYYSHYYFGKNNILKEENENSLSYIRINESRKEFDLYIVHSIGPDEVPYVSLVTTDNTSVLSWIDRPEHLSTFTISEDLYVTSYQYQSNDDGTRERTLTEVYKIDDTGKFIPSEIHSPENKKGIGLPFDYMGYQVSWYACVMSEYPILSEYPIYNIQVNDVLKKSFGTNGMYMFFKAPGFDLNVVSDDSEFPPSFEYLVTTDGTSVLDSIVCADESRLDNWKKRSYSISEDLEVTLYRNKVKTEDEYPVLEQYPIAKYKIDDTGKFIPVKLRSSEKRIVVDEGVGLPFDYDDYRTCYAQAGPDSYETEHEYPVYDMETSDMLKSYLGNDCRGTYMKIRTAEDMVTYMVCSNPESPYAANYLITANSGSVSDSLVCFDMHNCGNGGRDLRERSFTITKNPENDTEVTFYQNRLNGDTIVGRQPTAKYKIGYKGEFIPIKILSSEETPAST
ncbi:MAG: hypothetical protein LIP00_13780 [Parabacteroides sp.]|nr:hypothetical protein [Parabacteroides sp.]